MALAMDKATSSSEPSADVSNISAKRLLMLPSSFATLSQSVDPSMQRSLSTAQG